MDGVFGVDAHDLFGHCVVGFWDVAEALTEDDIAECRFFDSDQLATAYVMKISHYCRTLYYVQACEAYLEGN